MACPLSALYTKLRILLSSAITFVLVKLLWPALGKKEGDNESRYKEGIVYIHTFPRCFTKKVVNLSPYAVKVETWCRMKKVPYQVVETTRFSSKEKHIPWIIYNGNVLADSALIIERLQDEFDCHDDLNDRERGTASAVIRMLDESFVQLYFLYRYYYRCDEFYKYCRFTTVPKFMQYFILRQIGKGMMKRCKSNGFARYGEDHVINLGKKDIQALDGILGDKPYILGDAPTTVDATVFAHLSQVLYPDLDYPWKTFIIKKHPRLMDYCTRIKERYWPDWDRLVDHDEFE